MDNTLQPSIVIIEQPAAQRFRYECESRSAGSIPGVNSTPENKTYPAIEVCGYVGEVVVVVSCVTKDEPYRPHPHKLVGKGCNEGICTIVLKGSSLKAVFSNIGIQCVKKRDMRTELYKRIHVKKINPFNVDVRDMNYLSNIDLNTVKLCFEAFVRKEKGPIRLCHPVVSQQILQKKSNLAIVTLCSYSASAKGSDSLILLCNEVSRDDIEIHFFGVKKGVEVWRDKGDFKPTDVHKQTAIKFRTPRYTGDIDDLVQIYVQLVRPSDNSTSEPLPFEFRKERTTIKRPPKDELTHQLDKYIKRQREIEDISNNLQNSFLETFKSEASQSPQLLSVSNVSSASTSPSHFPMYTLPNSNLPMPSTSSGSDQQLYSFQVQSPYNDMGMQTNVANTLVDLQIQPNVQNPIADNFNYNVQYNFSPNTFQNLNSIEFNPQQSFNNNIPMQINEPQNLQQPQQLQQQPQFQEDDSMIDNLNLSDIVRELSIFN